MIELPENYQSLTVQEKKNWFARYCIDFKANGEYGGLLKDVSDEVRKEYENLKFQ